MGLEKSKGACKQRKGHRRQKQRWWKQDVTGTEGEGRDIGSNRERKGRGQETETEEQRKRDMGDWQMG